MQVQPGTQLMAALCSTRSQSRGRCNGAHAKLSSTACTPVRRTSAAESAPGLVQGCLAAALMARPGALLGGTDLHWVQATQILASGLSKLRAGQLVMQAPSSCRNTPRNTAAAAAKVSWLCGQESPLHLVCRLESQCKGACLQAP